MKTLSLTKEMKDFAISEAAKTLRHGGMLVFPTDTVYGLAVDATNQKAVEKLRMFKGQRGNKPISIAVRDQQMAQQYAKLNDVAKHLYSQFLPGPLTIISKMKDERLQMQALAKGIFSLESTVGVRIIPHPFVSKLFRHIDFPITATSANISNNPNPRSLEQWSKDTPIKKQVMVDLFINAGELPYAEPSTIIDTSKEDTEIVRQGTLDLAHVVARRTSHVKTFDSRSPEETRKIAEIFYKDLLPSLISYHSSSVIIALQGPLGAGKTVFAQGFAEALGITEPLRSPTYTLVKEYSFTETSNLKPQTLYHIDAWRLSSPEEFQDLGLDHMLKSGNIIVIEWPQRLQSLLERLAKKTKIIGIVIAGENMHRTITVTV